MNLVFLHGGPGYRDYLTPYFKAAFPPPVRTHFFDQAQGASVTVPDLVKQLSAKVQSISKPVTIVGHSWGGTLALEYLRNYSTEVDRLILIDPCVHHLHFNEEFKAEMAARNISEGDLIPIFFTKSEEAEGRKLLDRLNATFDFTMFTKILTDYLTTFDVLSVLKTLPIPVLNIFGSDDVRVPARLLRPLENVNPLIENLEIPGAGHFPFLLPKSRDKIIAGIQGFVIE